MVNLAVPVYLQGDPQDSALDLVRQLREAASPAEREAVWSYVQRNRGVLARFTAQLWEAYRDGSH